MSWLTWRQHRLEGVWALVLVALLAGCIGYVANQIWIASAHCPGVVGGGYCLSDDPAGQLAHLIVRLNLFQYGLVVLPALAGAFIGAPLVAREIESGTRWLAWTQGVTPLRWLLVKLALVFVPLLGAAALVGLLEVVLLNVQGSEANRWAYFDQQAPLTVAATFFALSLGVAAGAVIGRSIPAMAVTLLGFVIVRIGLAELARSQYMAPVLFTSHDLWALDTRANPTAWWLGNPDFYDSAGHLLSSNGPSIGGQASYVMQYYQPGDRFWAFQTIESAILFGLALLLVGFTIYWVTRRAS